MTADKSEEMMTMTRQMMRIKFETMEKKILKIESDNEMLTSNMVKSVTRTKVSVPNADALKHTVSTRVTSRRSEMSVSRDDDTGSFTNVSRARSETPSTSRHTTTATYMDRFMGPGVFLNSGKNIGKSKSALASRGYDTKLNLWGVCFASLMRACLERYTTVTGGTGHIVDDGYLMKVYSKIVGELYQKIKSADLPAVQSNCAHFMSLSFAKHGKDDTPDSTVNDWWELMSHTDGVECACL
ncbi:hypothetical protein CAC42_3934 [Sphaceloma murrayae]|uniref:Uncharacterized protein n=1 Tax=Sphaceloma murrayae TaxID=2082308 RepID=A0A2K1QSE8_9PEZI|nr:hypothetical protein CAC42_3934 [Sphaceloma murrayae]